MKNTGVKAKLKGEIKFLEIELNNRKKKFGIDLYNMLTNDKAKMLGISSGTLKVQEPLRVAFNFTKQDISSIEANKDIKQKDLDVLEVKGASSMPNNTANDKMKIAGRAVSNASKEAKLKGEMILLDREIKILKEKFGLDVFDKLQTSEETKKKSLGSKIRSAVNNNTQHEIDIQGCIDVAKADVTRIDGKIKSKEFEITNLDS